MAATLEMDCDQPIRHMLVCCRREVVEESRGCLASCRSIASEGNQSCSFASQANEGMDWRLQSMETGRDGGKNLVKQARQVCQVAAHLDFRDEQLFISLVLPPQAPIDMYSLLHSFGQLMLQHRPGRSQQQL